jgi:small subunit ribosomal protein S3
MGQKVHPTGFRLGVKVGDRSVKDWQGRWFATGPEYASLLLEDIKVRQHIMTRMADAGVSKVEIERSANMITVTIHAAKPGIVIGKSGVKVEELRRTLEAMTGKRIRVTIQEIRQPEIDAFLVARSIADQLEKRVAFRRAMKQAVQRAQRFGAKGVRVQVSGRLGGSEMSRREWDRWGRVPLHTLRADIDYGQTEAHTTYGVIGVKVWIYRGEILDPKAAMARGTGSDPINEPRGREGERRPRTRREREGGRDGERGDRGRPRGGDRS